MFNGDAKRDVLGRILHATVATVTFTKVNGDTRVMKCTLYPGLLPEGITNNGRGWHTEVTGTMSVWDVEKKDWRAFRLDSVIEVEYVKNHLTELSHAERLLLESGTEL